MSSVWEIGRRQLGTLSCEKGEQLFFKKMGGGSKKQNWGSVRVGCRGGVKQDIGVSQMRAVPCLSWSVRFSRLC